MRRGAIAAVAGAMVLTAVAWGRAATPTGLQLPADPSLALAALDRKIADLDAEDLNDERDLEVLGGRIAAAHARVVARGRALYRATRAGMLPIGGGFDALVEHAMKVERMRHGVAADLAAEKELRACAHMTETVEDRVRFVDQANRVRPLTLF